MAQRKYLSEKHINKLAELYADMMTSESKLPLARTTMGLSQMIARRREVGYEMQSRFKEMIRFIEDHGCVIIPCTR